MTGNETEDKRSNPENITGMFRVHKAIGIIGCVGTLIAIAAFFIPVTKDTDLTGKLMIISLFGLLSIPTILIYLFCRIDVDAEKIVYRNLLGIRKGIYWRDVIYADIVSWQGDIVIRSQKKRIKLYAYFRNFRYLEALILNYYPDAYSLENEFAAKIPGVKIVNDITIFMQKKINAVIGIIMVMLGIGYLFLFADNDEVILKYLFIGFHIIFGSYFVISFAVVRVYTDSQRLAYRNIFGALTEISWKEIKSVRSRNSLNRECLLISNGYHTIRINIGFSGFELIKEMIIKRSPKAALRKPRKASGQLTKKAVKPPL